MRLCLNQTFKFVMGFVFLGEIVNKEVGKKRRLSITLVVP